MLRSCILTIVAAACASAANALPAPSAPSYDAGEARPIDGWLEFCSSFPGECEIDPREPDTIRLDERTWQTILDVNARVNAAVRPVEDWEAYGVADRWTFPMAGFGDCEDYQLLKRNLLAQAGVPRRAMRMTVVIDENNSGHAVLMLRTDRGDFVLDNKHNRVVPWYRTGYTYVKREGSDGSQWTSLGHARSPAYTANGN